MKRLSFIFLLILLLFQVSVAQETKKDVIPNDTTIYSMFMVDKPASIPHSVLNEHVTKTLKYPIDALQKGIQGTVYVLFVVEKDGSISNVKVRKGINPDIDKEAVRVISTMPNWEPGKNKGVIVRTKNEKPVHFKIR